MAAQRGAPEAVDYALVDGVFAVHDALRRDIDALLAQTGLTETLADALWQLDPTREPLSRRALAERLSCDPSNVTFLVDRLEEKGLVERTVDVEDRRVKAIRLTVAGVDLRRRLIDGAAASPSFAALSAEEKQKLADLLGRCTADGATRHGSPTRSR
ncbi:MAG: MarR family transcriptional regulator [Pseudonocardiales bacterium]|nr:MarR family transcriptional regulator [Pseudonocardiales bacterium]